MATDLKLKAIISTLRHGEKNDKGELTETGHQQAAQKAKNTEYLKGDILLLHSGADRVRDTLVSFSKYLGITDPEKKLVEGKINYQGYTSQYLQYLYDAKNKGDLFGHWDDRDDKADNLDMSGNEQYEVRRIAEFLKLKNTSTEPEIYPSPKHMAIRLARVLATEIDFATITIPEVRTNFVNGTHEPVIMAFLYYFLQDYQPKDENFVETIGGTVNYADGFNIEVFQTLTGPNKVIFKFRDFEKEIDQIKLKEFCLSENVR